MLHWLFHSFLKVPFVFFLEAGKKGGRPTNIKEDL